MTVLTQLDDYGLWLAAVVAGLTAIGWLCRYLVRSYSKTYKWVKRAADRIDALDDLPGTLDTIDQIGTQVEALTAQVQTIHHEVTPNDGGSMKDSARRTEAAVKRVESEQVEQRKDTGGLRAEVRSLRERVDKLHP